MGIFKVRIKGMRIIMINAGTKKEAVLKAIQLLEGKKMIRRRKNAKF